MNRLSIAALALSAAGFVGLLNTEGYIAKAIIPVPGDVPTIGFGSTAGVRLGDTTTPVKAVTRALSDVSRFEGAIKSCVTVPLHQHEYDAFMSLAYNIGPGAFCNSTLVKKLNAGDYPGACGEILRWNRFNGADCSLSANKKLCGGLWVRRQNEAAKCAQSPR